MALKRQVDIASQLAVRTRAYLDVFEFYDDAETRPKILDVMNEYLCFFRLQRHVHLFAFLVETASLFKKDRKTVNYWTLLSKLSDKLAKSTRDEVERRLSASVAVCKGVVLIRNEVLAHRSATMDFNEAFAKAGLTRQQLKELTDEGIWIANAYCQAVGLNQVTFLTKETIRDAKRMFGALGAKFDQSQPTSGYEELFGKPS